jgi:hypothetical protein
MPKAAGWIIASGVLRGQSVIVSRTNRHWVGGISSKIVLRAMPCQLNVSSGVPTPASGMGFGNAKCGNPKYTTCRGSLQSKDTRDRVFPDGLGVPGFSWQRLCSSVGFGPGMRIAPRKEPMAVNGMADALPGAYSWTSRANHSGTGAKAFTSAGAAFRLRTVLRGSKARVHQTEQPNSLPPCQF